VSLVYSPPPDPDTAPAPDLLGIHHADGWTAVVIAHLDGPHPDLSPRSGDAGQTWALLDTLTSSPAPPPYAAAVSTAPEPSMTLTIYGRPASRTMRPSQHQQVS